MVSREDLLGEMDSIAYNTVNEYIGRNSEELIRTLKSNLEAALHHMLPVGITARIVEEDADMQLVRHIHEEPNDVVQIEVQLEMPVKYLVLQLEPINERLGIALLPVGSRAPSSTDPRQPSDPEGTQGL